MPTLYSDVDGTLAFGAKPNYGYVRALKGFMTTHPAYRLVVWSRAGEAHAEAWVRKLGLEARVREKDFGVVSPGADIVVDNQKLKQGITPGGFMRWARAGTGDLPVAGSEPWRKW